MQITDRNVLLEVHSELWIETNRRNSREDGRLLSSFRQFPAVVSLVFWLSCFLSLWNVHRKVTFEYGRFVHPGG